MKRIWLSTGALSVEFWLWRVTPSLTVLMYPGDPGLGGLAPDDDQPHDLPRPPLIAATLA